jgi:N-carbamoyl-L-amino-acid hydrolase
MISINGDRVISDLRELATIGAFQTGVDRVAFSAVDIQARRWLVKGARRPEGSLDRAGNVLGRDPKERRRSWSARIPTPCPRADGSTEHYTGVIYALEAARSAFKSGETRSRRRRYFVRGRGGHLPRASAAGYSGGDIAASEIEAKSKDGTRLFQALDAAANEAPHHRIDRSGIFASGGPYTGRGSPPAGGLRS